MGSTRSLLASSWEAACRRVDTNGSLVGNPATVAGQYLELAHGDAARAREMLPEDRPSVFWARVDALLAAVAAEERELQPLRRAGS